MDNLRSKSHLYNVIRAIRVVSFGPVSDFYVEYKCKIHSQKKMIEFNFIDHVATKNTICDYQIIQVFYRLIAIILRSNT